MAHGGFETFAFNVALQTCNCLRIFTVYLILNYCYYSIGRRIHCLKHTLSEVINRADGTVASCVESHADRPKYSLICCVSSLVASPDRVNCFRRADVDVELVHKAFDILCHASASLSEAFSSVSFCLITYSVFMIIWDGFAVTYGLIKSNAPTIGGNPSFWLIVHIVCLLVMCGSAELPTRQVSRRPSLKWRAVIHAINIP